MKTQFFSVLLMALALSIPSYTVICGDKSTNPSQVGCGETRKSLVEYIANFHEKCMAINDEEENTVFEMLQRSPYLANSADDGGELPFFNALSVENFTSALHILNAGAEISSEENVFDLVYSEDIIQPISASYDLLQELLQRPFNINAKLANGDTLVNRIMKSFILDDSDEELPFYVLAEIVDNVENPGLPGIGGKTPLHLWAAERQYYKKESVILFEMLRPSSDLEAKDRYGRTPLFEAIENSHTNAALILLENGARVDVVDNKGISLMKLAHQQHLEIFLSAVKNRIIDNQISRLIKSSFTALIKQSNLNINNANDDKAVTAKFSKLNNQNDLLMSFTYGSTTVSLKLRPQFNDEGGITSFALLENRKDSKTLLVAKSVTWNGVSSYKNGKRDPKIGLFNGAINAKFVDDKLVLQGRVNLGGKDQTFTWNLDQKGQAAIPPTQVPTPTKKNAPTKPAASPRVAPAIAHTYAPPEQLSGRYAGHFLGSAITFDVPALSPGAIVRIPVTIELNRLNRATGQLQKEHKYLLVKVEPNPTNGGFTLMPMVALQDRHSHIKDMTTYNGERIVLGKGKNKSSRTAFHALRPRPMNADDPQAFLVENSKGDFIIERVGELMVDDAPLIAEAEDAPDENLDIPQARNGARRPEPQPAPAQPAQAKVRKPRKPAVRREDYLQFSPAQERHLGFTESEERRNNRLRDIILEKSKSKENIEPWPKKDPNRPSTPKKIKTINANFLSAWPNETVRLNPSSDFADNPMFKADDEEHNLWFGQGYVLQNGEYISDPHKKIVLAFDSLNGKKKFSANASWSSFFNSEYGKENFANGMDIHLSFHKQEDGDLYLNLSGHARYKINTTSEDDIFLLMKTNADEQIVYRMQNYQRIKKRFTQDTCVEAARKYINFFPSEVQIAQEQERQEKMRLIKVNVENWLREMPGMKVAVKNKNWTFNFGLGDMGEFWQKQSFIGHGQWEVEMINDHTAFVVIRFLGEDEQPKTMTFKAVVNDSGIQWLTN
jgi:hypothetical protein